MADAKQSSTAGIALKTFELENEIRTIDPEDDIYKYNAAEQKAILNKKPWKEDPNYFKSVRISAIALIKMAMHARSGGSIEVMGVMTGKVKDGEFIVMDAYPLPVEGTETRVNALGEGIEYMVEYHNSLQGVNRLENVVGWYHSHPGYGCWLSGIDVGTQAQNQTFQDPFLGIVVDPNRTISAGKVEIGAFRTYPEGYTPRGQLPGDDDQNIPMAKLDDFGVHAAKYYKLKVSYFKSSLDSQLLRVLWNKYWTSTLAQSSLVLNHDYNTQQIQDMATRTTKITHSKDGKVASMVHTKLQTIYLTKLRAAFSGSNGDTDGDDKNALDSMVRGAVKVSSEELQGLILREIKHSLLLSTRGVPED
jgi:COP9 signalosome complex subunit 5